MDEGYGEHSQKVAVEWKLDKQSDVASIAQSLRSTCQQNLYVVPENEYKSNKPNIAASTMERLSFYRCYTSTFNKTEILCMQQNNVKRFFWFYISNVLCKSLPMIYVYVFLSTYSPDYHLYIPKIMPICYGCNFMIIMSAIFQLLVIVKSTSYYFIYIITGIIYKVPWNRCVNRTLYFNEISYKCYDFEEFSKKFNGTRTTILGFFYSTSEENFTVSQIEYFDSTISASESLLLEYPTGFIVIILWILMICFYKEIFKNHVWKLLHYSHVLLSAIYCVIFIHVVLSYKNKAIQQVESEYDLERTYLMNADFDLLAESMTAPPIVHILNSRSTEKVKPNLNSAVITTSNAVYYIFKALTSSLMEKYCENYANATIVYWDYGSGSHFYFWPMYFATLYMGDFYILIFFGLNSIVDFCTCLIVFRCTIETIISEWSWINPRYMGILIFIMAFIDHCIDSEMFAENYFIFFTGVSTLTEAIILFWMYPLQRFVDDITFHCGVPPTLLRVISFWIVPIFYLIKIYIMFYRFISVGNNRDMFEGLNSPTAAFSIQFALFTSGIVYSIYYYKFKEKKVIFQLNLKSWAQLFKPLPDWGPKDFASRQLRKRFDSKQFVGSQAPRDMSRHMIRKAELNSYKVDIQYDCTSRRSTLGKEESRSTLS